MAQGIPALHTSTKHLSILKYQETISSQRISQRSFFSLTVQIHIWPLLARFLHDAFAEHHMSASQEWLRLGGDVLHVAILILLSAEFLGSWAIRPLFLTVSKGWADSGAVADGIGQGEVCGCSPDRYPAAWPCFAWELPASGFPRASTPSLPPSQGQLRLCWHKNPTPCS